MNKIAIALLLVLTIGCSSKDKTDEELLENDKIKLIESLDAYKVSYYKFLKIVIRASAERDTISPEFQSFKSDFAKIENKVVRYDLDNPESLSVLDYISIYRDYKKMEDFIMKTDEDIFPTLVDAICVALADSGEHIEYRKGEEKIYAQNIEHTILSVMAILGKGFGKEISLYECSKTYPELLPSGEGTALLQCTRGLLFFEKGLYYLSEDEFTRNIDWLNNNKEEDFSFMKSLLQWESLSKEQAYLRFHALNHVLRGFDRLMMKREIDEKRALEDFEIFLKDAKEIGIDNEVVWSIEAYLYLKNEENEKAIAALSKLKTSDYFSLREKERIDESIEYVKNREPGKVLNGFYDKYFLSKITTKYVYSILSKIDWEKLMIEKNVPHAEEIFKTIENVKEILEGLDKYSSVEGIKQTGDEIKNKGKNLFNRARS